MSEHNPLFEQLKQRWLQEKTFMSEGEIIITLLAEQQEQINDLKARVEALKNPLPNVVLTTKEDQMFMNQVNDSIRIRELEERIAQLEAERGKGAE